MIRPRNEIYGPGTTIGSVVSVESGDSEGTSDDKAKSRLSLSAADLRYCLFSEPHEITSYLRLSDIDFPLVFDDERWPAMSG